MKLNKINRIKDLKMFTNRDSPMKLVIIGAGGSGGWFLNNLKDLTEIWLSKYDEYNRLFKQICIYDGDIVERKNIERQNFEEIDIGEYKVESLIKRMGFATGYRRSIIDGYTYSFTNKHDSYSADVEVSTKYKNFDLTEFDNFDIPIENAVFITFVDNVDIRLKLNDYLWENGNNFIHIDVGNNHGNGQLYNSMNFGNVKTERLRDKYPELKNKLIDESELSCAELSQQVEQILPINYMAGQTTLQYLRYLFTHVISNDLTIISNRGAMIKGGEHIKYLIENEIPTEIEFNLIPQTSITDSIRIYLGNRLKYSNYVKNVL